MPCVTGPINNGQIEISVAIGKEVSSNAEIFGAIVDTGSQNTCISERAAKQLGLIKITEVRVFGMHGSEHRKTYSAYIRIPVSRGNRDFEFEKKSFTEFTSYGSFDVIIGMDIITQGSLNVSGDRFVLCL